MKVIEIKNNLTTRKAYELKDSEQHYLEFKPDIDVLPAMYHDSEIASGNFYFKKRHEPNTPMWKEGGYECYDENGAFRAFHLDSLIIHPRIFRGKSKSKAASELIVDKPKGKRGRPKMDSTMKKTVEVYVKKGTPRGRPKMNPELKKTVTEYVPTGGRRGRPSKAK
jgi:hypothetical protein